MTAGSPLLPGVVVLDTNVIFELIRVAPDARVVDWMREVPPAMVYPTSVTLAEARFGTRRSSPATQTTSLGWGCNLINPWLTRNLIVGFTPGAGSAPIRHLS